MPAWGGLDLVTLQGFLVEETWDLSDTLGNHVSVEDKVRGGDWWVASSWATHLRRSDLIMA